MKNKYIAAALGIFTGGFGIHKFYLGKPGQGLLYILFCWTGIPEVLGVIEGVLYLLRGQDRFNEKYNEQYA
ncbi:TM2 domain-containing protein [Metabacillus sp. GX 13764]|uniref:TM2 domain-containing protein n=1 Tax=Metabacillus kandeliae TaxID=2900151 RepID=UPI001E3F7F60|nr:TM2 domain-containing protein [Metabacillus kandeliae]MCD7034486.1 TM2 domain-containing protein [Metabacillus kandeliae]